MSRLYNRKYELSYILIDKEDAIVVEEFLDNFSLNDIARKLKKSNGRKKNLTIDAV